MQAILISFSLSFCVPFVFAILFRFFLFRYLVLLLLIAAFKMFETMHIHIWNTCFVTQFKYTLERFGALTLLFLIYLWLFFFIFLYRPLVSISWCLVLEMSNLQWTLVLGGSIGNRWVGWLVYLSCLAFCFLLWCCDENGWLVNIPWN